MTLSEIQEYKCREIQNEISRFIEKGTDVEFGEITEHFSLTALDQINIAKLAYRAEALNISVPYHSDKNICRIYTPEEMSLISLITDAFISQFTTLINAYNIWIRRCATPEEVLAITPTSILPEDLQTNMDKILKSLNSGIASKRRNSLNESITALLNSNLEAFILTLCALATVWMGLSKLLDFIIDTLGIETKASLRRKKVDASIKEMKEMQNTIHELKQMMEVHIEKDKTRTVVSLRSTIWRMHGDFMKQGYVTKDGLEVFSEACKLYKNDGGNGVVQQKIEPEVMELPVK